MLKNVGLSADLRARLDELRASRQRLVSAQDVERRRLERDLHDGAPATSGRLEGETGTCGDTPDAGSGEGSSDPEELKGDADEALETLRDLARGIYPPLLADKGLVVALESQARKATVPVRVEAAGLRDTRRTSRRPCTSASSRRSRTCRSTRGQQRSQWLHTGDGKLIFEVIDDGAGFDVMSVRKGSG